MPGPFAFAAAIGLATTVATALMLFDTNTRIRAARFIVRFAGTVRPARHHEFEAELHAVQFECNNDGIDYALGALLAATRERAVAFQRAVVVRNVSKSYGNRVALSDVSLRVEPGEVCALLGGNGAGKSTLLRLLAGEAAVRRGRISFGDFDVSPRFGTPAGIAVIQRDSPLLDEFTVAANIVFGHRSQWVLNSRLERIQAAAALHTVKASINPDRRAGDLTPAERIQVQLAREIHQGTSELLVLDEPTAGIGNADARALFDSIEEIKNLGYGLIVVSHRIDRVLRIADRIAILYDGRLVHNGCAHDVTVDEILLKVSGGPFPVEPMPDVHPAISA